MKKILSLLIMFSIFSCEKEKSKNTIDPNYKIIDLKILNATIKVPNQYKKISPEKFKKIIRKNNNDEAFINQNINKIEQFKNSSKGLNIVIDTTNVFNNIWFFKGEYVPLSKNLAQQYLAMTENSISNSWSEKGISYKRLENKFISRTKAKIIKLKYQLDATEYTKFTTQYVVTTKRHTFLILVNNLNNIDYENILYTIRYKD